LRKSRIVIQREIPLAEAEKHISKNALCFYDKELCNAKKIIGVYDVAVLRHYDTFLPYLRVQLPKEYANGVVSFRVIRGKGTVLCSGISTVDSKGRLYIELDDDSDDILFFPYRRLKVVVYEY